MTAAPKPWDGDEEWRSVVGFEGLYEVSSTGRVKNTAQRKGTRLGHLLKAKTTKKGHAFVNLFRASVETTRLVHTLVADAFIGPRPVGLLVLHRDDNKINNCPSNLYHGTHTDNVRDAIRNGSFAPGKRKDGRPRKSLTAPRQFNSKPTPAQILEARRLCATMSCRTVARNLGLSKTLVHRIQNGEAYSDVR